jgi:hypothetical protein
MDTIMVLFWWHAVDVRPVHLAEYTTYRSTSVISPGLRGGRAGSPGWCTYRPDHARAVQQRRHLGRHP